MRHLLIFLCLFCFSFTLAAEEVQPQQIEFPLPPAKILSKYIKDKEITNFVTVDSEQIHWRNRYKKVGVKYFSEAELENLLVTVNAEGLLTYKGTPLLPGSYSYILSQEGKLFAFLRKTPEGKNINKELTTWFKKQVARDSALIVNAETKEPLFHKIVCKHSSLSHGERVLSVGDFEIAQDGVAAFFNNTSGHYRLGPLYMKNLAHYLYKAGVKDLPFDLFYKNAEKKIRKKQSTLLEVLNTPENAPLFTDLP